VPKAHAALSQSTMFIADCELLGPPLASASITGFHQSDDSGMAEYIKPFDSECADAEHTRKTGDHAGGSYGYMSESMQGCRF